MSDLNLMRRPPFAEGTFESPFLRFDWELGDTYFYLTNEMGSQIGERFRSADAAIDWAKEKGFSIVGE